MRIITNEYQDMYEREKALDELKKNYEFFRKYSDDELLNFLKKDK